MTIHLVHGQDWSIAKICLCPRFVYGDILGVCVGHGRMLSGTWGVQLCKCGHYIAVRDEHKLQSLKHSTMRNRSLLKFY